jgi:formamidopyrimidine-DNA glycosylase
VPELPEVERYRVLAESALHRDVTGVVATDAWYLKRGLDEETITSLVVGRRFVDARRTGKLLLLDVDGDGLVVGLRFGMSGRLIVDGRAGVDDLLYTSNREDERWDRFVVRFADGGDLRMRDPRRLGGVELSPNEALLGPDARTITRSQLARALRGARTALKARLMDQAHVAGVGNLIADEALWRAGLDPHREAGGLDDNETRRLHRHLTKTIADLIERGGSHLGDVLPFRQAGARCPRDGAEMVRSVVGGRTTWWCPEHQR